mmetsp:Transcript_6973/g.17839  ORF Transcript_6973/g.17839 Transcript_6973/m.17839 type:complete len:442 (-) Transcript_6973:471-1796(-)
MESMTAASGGQGACSVALDVLVDSFDKKRATNVADCAAHHRQPKAEEEHVAKVEDRLEESRHFGLEEEVVDRVDEDVHRSARAREERRPRPPIVLVVEQEVGDDDRYADCYDREDHKHEQQEAIHVVELVVPERGEDEVHLDEDGAERQNAAKEHENRRLREPLLFGHQARDRVHAARVVSHAAPVAAEDRANHRERDAHKQPEQKRHHDRAERDRAHRAVCNGDHVEDCHRQDHDDGEERGGVQKHTRPLPASKLHVQGPRGVAAHERCEEVARDARRHHRASAGVQREQRRSQDHEKRKSCELCAAADQRRKEHRLRWHTEHVAVDLLPAGLVQVGVEVVAVCVARVPRVVPAQRAHEDERHNANEEDHHHERVEDGEPVDLVLEEVVVEVPLEALVESDVDRLPLHRVCERDLRARAEARRALRCEVDLDDAVAVVPD